jgi:hypothetical protein
MTRRTIPRSCGFGELGIQCHFQRPNPKGAFGQVAINGDGGEQLPYLFHQQRLFAPQGLYLAQQFGSGRLVPNAGSLAGAAHIHIGKVPDAGDNFNRKRNERIESYGGKPWPGYVIY